MNRIINLSAFGILTVLWIAFGAALLLNQGMLDTTWQMFAGWPLVVQVLVGLLVLPVVAGLWIWETSWPVLLRLVLVAGLAWVTVYTFRPRNEGSQAKNVAKNA